MRASWRYRLACALAATLPCVVSPPLPSAAEAAEIAAGSVDPDDGPFTIVVVPDTQHEVDTEPDDASRLEFPWQLPRLARNAAWLCEQRDPLRIAAVLHVGDFVQGQPRGVHTQWDRVATLLDAAERCGIPWLGALGNHDCDAGSNGCAVASGGDRASNFQRHVARRQARQAAWQGAGPEIRAMHGACGLGGAMRAPSRIGWIRFARRFAAISLDWYPNCPPQDDWVRAVLAEHGASTHFVLLGHAIARPGDSPDCAGATEPGQAARASALARAGGVFAVVGGHYVQDPSFACQGVLNVDGRPVLNLFSNFQTNGTTAIAGTLVLIRVDVGAGPAQPNVCVRQVNPSLGTRDVTEPQRCFAIPELSARRRTAGAG